MTTEKKTRKPRAKSKAAQIRRLCEQGKLTPKQIAEKVGVPVSYVYVLRSKIKAERGGLPAVLVKPPMPVPGGIQEVATEAQAAHPAQPTQSPQPQLSVRVEEAAHYRHIHTPTAPVVVQRPPLWERMKERVRAWLA